MKNLFTNRKVGTSTLTRLALMFIIFFAASGAASATGNSVAAINARLAKSMYAYQNKQVVVGGDFSLDFVASAPYTYNHLTGGGAFDDRTIGKNNDVVESLEGGDFKCQDIVSFLTKISVRSGAGTGANAQTIRINYSFLAAATGQPGVALGSFVGAYINDGAPIVGLNAQGQVVNIGEGLGFSDSGNRETGTVKSAVVGSSFGLSAGSTLFQKPAKLEGYVDVNGLEGGESVILRVDVRIHCDGRKPTGNLQGALSSARVIAPSFPNNQATISTGGQTIPFKNVDAIQQGTCELDQNYDKACEGDIKAYTLTTNGIPTWSLTGDGIFTDANGVPVANNDPGAVNSVWVKATAPSGLKGSYTVRVDINSTVTATFCEDQVDVYKNAEQPAIVIHEATLCGTIAKPWIEVCSPIHGLTYELQYGPKDINGNYTKSASKTYDSNNSDHNPLKFEDLDAGYGFRIRAVNQGECPSAWTDCNSGSTYLKLTCSINGNIRQAAPTSKPQTAIGKANDKDIIAYPIPFSEKVTIEFKSKKAENYVVNLYDMQGRLVKQLATGTSKAGEVTRLEVDGKLMIDGMYLIRKESKSGTETIKLLKKE